MIISLCLFSVGCSRTDLADEAFIDGLRLLGAQAEPPEASPGEPVMMTAWAVNPKGAPIDIQWSACLLPSNGVADIACVTGTPQSIALGTGATLPITVPNVMRSALGPPDATDGVYLPIVMHVTSGGDSLDAVYRLRIKDPASMDQPNNNPQFADVEGLPLDGSPQIVHKGDVWPFVAQYVDGSSESYHISIDTMSVHEFLTTQWFSSAGTFPNQPVGGTGVQALTIDRALPPAGGDIDLWLVGHDDRGGTAMIHRTLIMQ